MIRYYVYDGFGFGAEQTNGFEKRKYFIDTVLPKYTKYVEHVQDYIVHSFEEMDKIYQTFLTDEQEGAIIRILDKPYENKRSKFLLKYKPLSDSESFIKDIQEGQGNWKGSGKIIVMEWEGKTFNATFKGNYKECVQFLNDKDKWIGKKVKFLYNGLTGLGIPNYARMDINNCDPSK